MTVMYIPVCVAQSQQKVVTIQMIHPERQDDVFGNPQTGM